MFKQSFLKDHAFLRRMLAVALPVAIQFLISTSINMADTVMISSLGDASIAAVGLVNQFVFFFLIVVFGISSAGAVFYAQHFGHDDLPGVRRFLVISLQLSTIIAIPFTVICLLWPQTIMRFLIPDLEVIAIGVGYLRIVALTFIFTGLSQSFNTVLRTVNRNKEPLAVSTLTFFTNVFFNYIFIFGHFGAPALGAVGAGVGTLIARILEVLFLGVLVFKGRKGHADVRPVRLHRFDPEGIRRYFKIALPIITAETLWSFGQLLFAIAYARIGKEATAAIQLTATIQNVFFILTNAISSAAAVVIGQTLGANEHDKSLLYSGYFIQLTLLIGALSAVILILLPDLLLAIYSGLAPELYQSARLLLIIRGAFIVFRFVNGMLFVGILRPGGDTKVPLYLEIFTMWVYAIPAAFFCVLVLHWPISLVFIVVSFEEVIKTFLIVPRFRKRLWIQNIAQQPDWI